MTGVMRAFGRSRWLVVLVAALTSLALFTGVTGPAAAAVRPKLSEDGEKRRPKVPKTASVKARTLKARTARLPGSRGTPVQAKRPEPSWPAGGQGTADLSTVKSPGSAGGRSAGAPWVQVGKLPVWLTAPTPGQGVRRAVTVPQKATVRVLDRKAARAAGTDGLMLTVAGASAGRVKVGVNYSSFKTAHGGDWAARLRLVRLPACALKTPSKRECQQATPVPTSNDPKTGTLSADVDVPADSGQIRPGPDGPGRTGAPAASATSATVLAAQAGPSGPGGDWTATKLTPASNWTAGSNTGEFSWSYPVRVPPVPGDLKPEVTLGYSSGAVDGKTAADNSQASWVGDGFDYWPGFIERKYKACADEGKVSGDLCWGRQNAVMSLNGRSTELIWDSQARFWRPKNDDGSTVERLTGAVNGDEGDDGDRGEYWRLTTLDGMQYIFGRNRPDDWSAGRPETGSTWTVPVFGDDSGEPCHKAAFKDSWCDQAWRWNLDHVIDPHNSTITYYYAKETNNYTRVEQMSGGTPYVSGGHLQRIEYGQRQGATYGEKATARILFQVAGRSDFPDDRICEDGKTCGFTKLSPTFFDRSRLTKITSQLRNDGAVNGYDTVDTWDLGQTYQNGALWLNTIKQVGRYRYAEDPAPTITLVGQLMTNRVVSDQGGTGVDALPAHYRPRLVGVSSGTGSITTVTYSDPYPLSGAPADECRYVAGAMPDPKTNIKRCFPVKWRDPDGKLIDDWYHKYVVKSVTESDETGGSRLKATTYNYLGGAAWRYTEDDGLTKDKWRTWSQWRGYRTVRTLAGSGERNEEQSRTETTYARGMDGNYQGKGKTPANVTVTDSHDLIGVPNPVPDLDAFAGDVIETRTFNGSFTDAAEVSAKVSKPKWAKTVTRTFKDTVTDDDITVHAGWVRSEWSKQRSKNRDGADRYTETFYHYNGSGQTVAVDDEGDPGTPDDDTCTRTVYPGGPVFSGVLYIWSLPVRVLKVAVDCDNPASHEPNLVAADMISDVKTIYDGGQYGEAPTRGDDRQLETVTGVSGGKSVVAKTVTNVHDRYGRITTATQVGDPGDPADDRTTTSKYDDAPEGWLKSSAVTTPPVSVGGQPAEGFTTTTVYNPARGTPVKVTDPNGRTAEADYDGLGRLVKAWLPDRPRGDNPEAPSTVYTYRFPADGNPVSITTRTLKDTDPVTYDTSVELLDGLLRPRQSQTEAAISGQRLISDTFYDSRGLVYRANTPYPVDGAPTGVLTTAEDAVVPARTIADYDGAGRPTTSTLFHKIARKWATTTRYRGSEEVTEIPPAGGTPVTSKRNARGQMVETRRHRTADASDAGEWSRYSYDAAGRPSSLTDRAGNAWSTRYDVQGRTVSSTDPDKGTTETTYDHFDQVKTVKDARGSTLTSSYDKLGRQLEVRNGGTLLTSYTYDTLAKGKPTSSTRYVGGQTGDAYTTAVYGYDTLYRPTGSNVTIPASEGPLAGTYTTRQSYNFDGTPRTTQYPAAGGPSGLPQENVTTYYKANGLPDWNTGLSTYVAGTDYNSYGEVAQVSMAAVSDRFIWQTFYRDEATRRITSSTYKRQTSSDFIDSEFQYNYTDSGSITSILTNTTGQSTDRQCFTYDYSQRLTQAWATTQNDCAAQPTASTIGGPAPYWTSYEYDPNGNSGDKAGNRTKEIQHAFPGGPANDNTRTYTYPTEQGVGGNNGPHALKSVTTDTGTSKREDLYTYDEAGNTTNRPGQKLNWNAEGDLAQVTTASPRTDTYKITSLHSGQCVNIGGASQEDGAGAIQWTCVGAPNEQWKLVSKGGDEYTIVSVNSGKCLDVAGNSPNNNAVVIQYRCVDGADNQRWKKVPVKGGYQLVAKHSGKCLDVPGGSTTTGTQLDQWDCVPGAPNEIWQLTLADEIASYLSDADGNRLIRKDIDGRTLYLPGQEVKVSNVGTVSAIRYYSHGGQTIAYRTGTSSSTINFLAPDYQGTNTTTTNAVDQNNWSMRRFGPFGTERTTTIGTWPRVMDKGYVGGTKDNTGLTHLGAREYDPTIGRFTSVDPIFAGGDPTTWNGFAYAGSNPIDHSDPTGLCRDVNPALGPISCHAPGNDGDTTGGGVFGDGGATGDSPTYKPPYVPPAKPPCKSFLCKAGKFLKKHSATIVATAASVAVGVGCGAAIGWTGAGAVGCAAAAGAVYGAIYHGMSTPRDQWTATGFLKSAAIGAVTGVVTAGVAGLAAKAAAPLIKKIAPRITAKITGGGKGGAATPAKGAGGACKNSFVSGTTVVMADGSRKPIDHIQVGDKVLATDPITGKTRPQTVTTTFTSTGTKNLVRLTIDTDGKHGTKTSTLTATDNHPFWVQAQHTWINAGQLKPGTLLRTSAGTYIQLTTTKTWAQHRTVHNLTVDTDRTYYVVAGKTAALVHNCPTTVYRRQAHPDSQRLSVDAGGNVNHQGSGTLYVNMSGDAAHSAAFRDGAGEVVTFDMPSSYVNSIIGSALPQRQPSSGPLSALTRRAWRHLRSASPEISDPHQSSGLIGIPDSMIDDFMSNIVPGSGRTL